MKQTYGVAFLGAEARTIIYKRSGHTRARTVFLGSTSTVRHDRPYTKGEAQQVCDWVNGTDQPLPSMQSERDDPLMGQHRKA